MENVKNSKETSEKVTSQKEAAKSQEEIMGEQISHGEETFDKTPLSLWLSSLAAGLEIGFSFLLICAIHTFFIGKVSDETIFKLMAFGYPIGFIMIIGGKSILFTEKTSLLVLPVLNKKRGIDKLLITWVIVIFGNLVGGWLMAPIIVWIGPHLHIIEVETFEAIALHVTEASGLAIFVSAILAGWMMGLLSWLLTSAKESISRIVLVYLITSVLAFLGLHHSIVGNIEMFAGLLTSSEITWDVYALLQGNTLLGNAIGGAVFVALLKYSAFVNNKK